MKTNKRNYSGSILILLLVILNQFFLSSKAIGQENNLIISNLKKHIAYLASDELQGRATGSKGARLASDYIAENLTESGIKAFGDSSSYFQNIPMCGSYPLPESKFLLINGSDSLDLRIFRDYLLFKTGAQTYIPNPVPLVFVGFGIIAPEYDYNDYLYEDVRGKIVVFLSGEPEFDDPDYFAGNSPTIYSYPESKQRIAISQGAIGSIMIPNPLDKKFGNWKQFTREFYFEDVTLAYRVTGNLSVIINPELIPILFKNAPNTFEESINQIKQHKFKSFTMNATASFKGHFKEREFLGRNVAGYIKGTDPELRETYILLSAHYDHLGIGPAVHGDSIYNGVVDNALGVSALLEIARMLEQDQHAPRRSVVFLFLTGEEKGLLGSQYYVDHPLVPLYKTIANVNIDGLAIFDEFNDVVGIGSEFSTLSEILEAVARVNGLHLSTVPPQFLDYESFARSDQIAFAQGGIPSILISDGLNYKHLSPAEGLKLWIQWADQIYHTPFDDLFQPLNYAAIEEHVLFLCDFCHRLSRMEQQPQWRPGTVFRNIRLQTIAEKR